MGLRPGVGLQGERRLNMWFILSLIFALATSLVIVIAKKITTETDEYLFLFVGGLFTIPALYLITVYFYQIPEFDSIFLSNTLAAILLNSIAAVLAYRAIRIEDISLVGPISAFNPVFTTVIALFVLGEQIGTRGIAGILLVSTGAYLLQLGKLKRGFIDPIQKLVKNKGVQLSLIAYFIWAITPVLQKTAILHTTPLVPPFASLTGTLGTVVVFGFLTKKYSKRPLYYTRKFLYLFLVAGIIIGIAQAAGFVAFSLAQLGFVTAVFKLSIVFSVLLGWLFFKERNIKDRLLGSLVMLAGVILLAI